MRELTEGGANGVNEQRISEWCFSCAFRGFGCDMHERMRVTKMLVLRRRHLTGKAVTKLYERCAELEESRDTR